MTPNEPEPVSVAGREPRAFDATLAAYLSGIGFLCAAALEFVHMQAYGAPNASSFCSAGAKFDCTTVALSRWSVIGHVPVPVWGMAGFLALGLTAWWRSTWFLFLSAFAALSSFGFLVIELTSIHSLCLFCEGVHLVSWVLFALAWRGRDALVRTPAMTLVHLFTVPVGIILESYFLMTPYWTLLSLQHGVQFPQGVTAEGRHWIGAENPKVVLHEYVNYSCPHCAVGTTLMRQLLARHPKELRIVRHQDSGMRCPFVPGGAHCELARAAGCAGEQGKFWEMDSWLFQHASGKTSVDDYSDAARELKLDGAKLKACMSTEASFAAADSEASEVYGANLSGTPAYIIDGKQYSASEAFEALKKAL
jgi:protein-disulfide isomerase/uncharacterized membrane protein